MKRIMLIACLIAACFTVCAENTENKLKIKSVIVEYSVSKMGVKFKFTSKTDDYGNKNVKIFEFFGHEIGMYCLPDGKMVAVDFNDRKASVKPDSDSDSNSNSKLMGLSEKELKKLPDYKDLGVEQILGKECKKISLSVDGAKCTMWSWDGLVLKMVMREGGKITRLEATSIKENAEIDPAEFELPDYAVAELERLHGK